MLEIPDWHGGEDLRKELVDEGEEEDDQLVDLILFHLTVSQAGDTLRAHLKFGCRILS